ncbi:DUF294 nucleotidyltransferase-like domain-containing protein [Dokdonia sp. 4H-3-7-5]|uniref:DUF294 nucleotidyltransferase-like domain-containing protein n=1 Tax=Dokdonia sp. (strain 4H-3-7-5) TaxID=983548 RepID=UPI00020A664C|nr:DUF294 nucleotidyltransferase-like domain-containing protein [Dokdonia sp. 4H-3-7-5]AEE18933.1 putative CBS domain and cyclic nucleotide-regulated nucleotidyltransferase [Dokdonia sp. 4H-3-7-5]
MQNTIAQRIYDFLKQFPPFQFMAEGDLLDICSQASVLYLDKDEVIFNRDQAYNDRFYIVQQGAIKLTRPSKDVIKVVDICDEGDLFGLKVTSTDTYRTTATAKEETILYTLPMEEFSAFAKANKAISNYLIASFASNIKDPYTLQQSGSLLNTYEPERSAHLLGLEQARYSTSIITCSPETSIQEAARLMQQHRIGCLVITVNAVPVGVLTNRELRNAIANNIISSDHVVGDAMITQVVCAVTKVTVAQAQLILLKNGISHLIITEDGTASTKVVGLLSKHDIVVAYGNSPAELVKEIKRAKKTKMLRFTWEKATLLLGRYLDQNLPISHILNIFSELKDALMQRTMELSLSKMAHNPPVSFTWLALGSQGREEQLLYTDQDNALIYEDVSPETNEATKNYFLHLANRMNKRLHKIGYDYCPADMMGSNPLYCLSLSEWKAQFSTWVKDPSPESMLLSGIFFDYRMVYGTQELVGELTASIYDQLSTSSVFFRFMAKDALKNPPPVSFFRNFLVESDGAHKDEFDIKNRAMAPLISGARVLSLYHNLRNINHTSERFEKLAELEPQNKELFESCAYAFKALLKFRVKQGLRNDDSGRFIKLADLSKEERLKLKRCFKPLRDLQEVVRVRFQTQNLS